MFGRSHPARLAHALLLSVALSAFVAPAAAQTADDYR